MSKKSIHKSKTEIKKEPWDILFYLQFVQKFPKECFSIITALQLVESSPLFAYFYYDTPLPPAGICASFKSSFSCRLLSYLYPAAFMVITPGY